MSDPNANAPFPIGTYREIYTSTDLRFVHIDQVYPETLEQFTLAGLNSRDNQIYLCPTGLAAEDLATDANKTIVSWYLIPKNQAKAFRPK